MAEFSEYRFFGRQDLQSEKAKGIHEKVVEFKGDFSELKFNKSELMQQAWFEKPKILQSMMYPEQVEVFKRVLEELDKLKEDKIF